MTQCICELSDRSICSVNITNLTREEATSRADTGTLKAARVTGKTRACMHYKAHDERKEYVTIRLVSGFILVEPANLLHITE